MGRVLVAMSGGVDSSVAAALTLREGHQVIGVTMTLAPSDPCPTSAAQSCCSEWDVRDAEKVCWRLGIPHYVFDFREEFAREVIGNFVEEYARGRTPIPCARCNSRIKFEALLERARMLGAERVVTGHHARLRPDPRSDGVRLMRSRDPRKDQSYFLAGLSPAQLARAGFPIGEHPKAQVREIARDLGLAVAEKSDSQDLCFVPGGDTAGFLESRLGPGRPGPILDEEGRVLGTHRGLFRYTVGQRRGLGISAAHPLYVLSLDGPGNAVVVGEAHRLLERVMEVEDLNWLAGPVARARVQVRSTSRGEMADLELLEPGRLRVRFDRPQRALTPGQAAVFYRRDQVLGGGIIARTGRS